jgi:hypothetical protein
MEVPVILSGFNETRIFLKDFRKILKYQIYESPSTGSRVVSFGQTDRQTGRYDDANSSFL